MPSYGRWRHSKIVVPVSRAKEISGGIKNALDRGESLSKAKQSFINAGYTPQEVQSAAQMIRQTPSGKVSPPGTSQSKPLSPQPQPTATNKAKETTSKKTIIILTVVGVIILAVALFLGLFWNKIF